MTIKFNRYCNGQQFEIIMDKEDYERLAPRGIRVKAFRQSQWGLSVGRFEDDTRLCRAVLNYEGPLIVDHINRNYFDNRKENLRLATVTQSAANRGGWKNAQWSKFKGVSFDKSGKRQKRWYAKLQHQGTTLKKNFLTEREAALQYNEWAYKIHGEFAVLNEVD